MTWEHWTILALWVLGFCSSSVIGDWEKRNPWFDLVIFVGWPFIAVYALLFAVIDIVRERSK